MKVKIGLSNSKRYKHFHRITNSTTANFTSCQPVFSRFVMPNSKTRVKLGQFVRLNPLPFPTFGDCRMKNAAIFVPIEQVMPQWAAFMSAKSYRNSNGDLKICTRIPTIKVSTLSELLLTRYAHKNVISGTVSPSGETGSFDFPHSSNIFSEQEYNSIKSADYSFLRKSGAIGNDYTFDCYTFYSDGRNLLKELQGLGFQLSLDDDTSVSLLPLLAYSKAKFDRFFPNRLQDWETTWTYRFIRKFEDAPLSADIVKDSVTSWTSYYYALTQVLDEIRDTVPTHEIGWLEAHQADIRNSQSAVTPLNDTKAMVTIGMSPTVVASESLDSSGSNMISNPLPAVPALDTTKPVTKWSVDLLRRMTQYVVKDSVIGNRLQLWLKSHLDSDVYNIVYQLSNNIAGNELQINIGDINSTADTSGVNGEALGSYAGKGIGSGAPLSFTYKANTYGFIIVLSWIEVETDYYQGTDTQLFMSDRYSVPQQEFDALGYEVTPYSAVWADNFYGLRNMTDSFIPSNTIGFGFIPRYSGWKHLRNIVNGDFRLGRYKNSMNLMYMDKEITASDISLEKSTSGKNIIGLHRSKIPVASTAWQYNCRYPWLSNFNRIFYNSGNTSYAGLRSGQNIPDNFYVHCVIDVEETNTLKPLSASYDATMDGNVDMNTNMS